MIDNKKLLNTMQIKVKIPTLSHNIIQKAKPYCTKCRKKVLQLHKGIYCTSCNHIIHKKCSTFNKNDTCPMRECLSCISEKFPFCNINNDELISTNYNSNDTCPCGNKPPKINIRNLLEQYKVPFNTTQDKETPIANSIVENTTDQFIDLKPNFNYYDIHEFHKLKHNKIPKSTFSLIHTNIGSLQANIEKFELLINHLECKFDVISLTETCNPENKKDIFHPKVLDGYKNYLVVTGSTSKGGCGFYLNENLNFIERKDLNFKFKEDDDECESIWVELINKSKPNTLIGSVYHHPTQKNTLFIKALENTLNIIKKERKSVIVSGAFNLNLLYYEINEMTTNFLDTMLTNSLQPCILEPTRITNNCKPSLVDNIFINTLGNMYSGNILENISYDHLPNFIIFESEPLKQTNKPILVKNFDQNAFTKELFDLHLSQQIELAENSNHAYNIFHKNFLTLMNKPAPFKSLSKREINIKQKSWLTKGILTSIDIKRRFFKKFKKTNRNYIYIKYKYYRDVLNSLIRKSKKNHYKVYFEKNIRNSKKTWDEINKILSRKGNKQYSYVLHENGNFITDHKQVANKFNQFFTNYIT